MRTRACVCVCVCVLVGWVLWHINLCYLLNAKSICIQIISSISMSTYFDCKKHFYLVYSNSSNSANSF